LPEHLHLSTPGELVKDHAAAKSPVSAVAPMITEQLEAAQRTHSHRPEATASRSGTAALSEPLVNRSDSTDSVYASSKAAGILEPNPRVAAGPFDEAATSIGATAVSNRTVMQDEALAVPTLEDLESSAGIRSDSQRYHGPNFSRTPFGLSDADLLLHLDELIQRSSPPATSNPAASYSAAGSPTSSN
jgi:hypothetical protein